MSDLRVVYLSFFRSVLRHSVCVLKINPTELASVACGLLHCNNSRLTATPLAYARLYVVISHHAQAFGEGVKQFNRQFASSAE